MFCSWKLKVHQVYGTNVNIATSNSVKNIILSTSILSTLPNCFERLTILVQYVSLQWLERYFLAIIYSENPLHWQTCDIKKNSGVTPPGPFARCATATPSCTHSLWPWGAQVSIPLLGLACLLAVVRRWTMGDRPSCPLISYGAPHVPQQLARINSWRRHCC